MTPEGIQLRQAKLLLNQLRVIVNQPDGVLLSLHISKLMEELDIYRKANPTAQKIKNLYAPNTSKTK